MISRTLLRICLLATLFSSAFAQPFDQSLYQNLRWRMIGPHRGGRTVGVAGIPDQPNVFFIGVNNGGVWRTNDYGRTWTPIFDDQPTGSVGALAVAPSDPNIIYVGSGEGLQRPDLSVGDGVYKSSDGGKSWKHCGLTDAQQIGAVIIDPRNPDRVFVAALGHPYGANAERGVFRSVDGGTSWQKVLYKDENTGAIALEFDPTNPDVIYSVLWSSRLGPWENGEWQGEGSGLYKSMDGGNTWRQLTKGLPTFKEGLGRIGIGIARNDPRRMYALVDAAVPFGGLYRSDDAGDSWRRINNDERIWGRGSDFAEVKVDPKNPDIVYVANIVAWRSADAGQTFTALKGAPGGDDYHTIWINPTNPNIILLATDQGATLTVNGGETWSSWYNQPTAQFYHVSTDNQFPYWVYGGQQESGSIGIASRGNDGQITFREWHSVGVEEYGYVAPDPLDANIIYGGKITRYNKATGQSQNISPEAVSSGKYRFIRTAPVLFSSVDPHALYFAGNVLFKTTSGGNNWDVISPDLTREAPDVPANIGIYRIPEMAKQPRRGVIYTVAPSYKDAGTIWAGTDDGLIHITNDGGKNWKNITPPGLTAWSKVSILDASHFDNQTAYAAVNRIRLDDLRPHIYRTHDDGKTWKEIVGGLPDNAPVNVVREDPQRKGLLYCGTERAVFVSFDDGENWQPLRLNMPATSIRDLVIHDDDIVVGTHGRSFWILDDITPLRQIDAGVAASDAFLFKPQIAYRVRWNTNTDTPLPPEEPAGQNPPDGALINYYLKTKPASPIVLEIFDEGHRLVRKYSSDEKPEPVNANKLNIPTYWIRSPQNLSSEKGMQRFVWDMHYSPPAGFSPEYPMAAIHRDTPRFPLGPWVHPGEYTVSLTVEGKTLTQPLIVKMDPRVKTSPMDLKRQFELSMKAYDALNESSKMLDQVRTVQSQIKKIRSDKMTVEVDEKLGVLEGTATVRRVRRASMIASPGLREVNVQFRSLLDLFQEADATPTSQATSALEAAWKSFELLRTQWTEIKAKDLKALNDTLVKLGQPPISY